MPRLTLNGEPRDISLQTVALIAPDLVEREGLRACEITLEYPFSPEDSRLPKIHPTAFVAPGARIAGDVEIEPEASVWFNAVIRGDSAPVRIGAGTNIQDGAVLHTDPGVGYRLL